MTLQVITTAYSEDVSTAATSWTITHGLKTESPVIDVYDGSDTRVIPAAVVVIDEDTLRVDWSTATSGRVYVV